MNRNPPPKPSVFSSKPWPSPAGGRCVSGEKNLLATEITKLEATQPCDDYATTVAAAFRSLADNSHSLQLIQRYDAYSFRSFLRCLKTLTELQEGIAPNEPDSRFS
jgi:hypothetical protein